MNILTRFSILYKEAKDRHERAYLRGLQKQVVFDPKRKEGLGDTVLTDEQKAMIDAFYLENYGKKIDYTCHLTYYAYSGKFDAAFFPELLYIPEFEYFLNAYREYNYVLSDKNVTPMIARSARIKTTKTLYSCCKGLITTASHSIITRQQLISELAAKDEFFMKKTVDSVGGFGCMRVRLVNGIDAYSGKSVDEIVDFFKDDYIIQECLRCNKNISDLHPQSVNTLRVMTYRWKDDIFTVPSIMRMGIDDMSVDNASSGGLFIGVEDDGRLLSCAMNKYGKKYRSHPNTHIQFSDYRINKFEEVRSAAKLLHSLIPYVGIVSWDFTIDENDDVVLIEGNMNAGGVWLHQMTHGKAIFGDNTAEILQWTRKMKATPVGKRKIHAFGY